MTVTEVTGLVSALTALVVAIGGVITAIKVLREVKTGNQLTETGNHLSRQMRRQLFSQRSAVDKYQEDVLTALAGASVPDESKEESNAVQESEKR